MGDGSGRISVRWWGVAAVLSSAFAAILLFAMDRPPICTCGVIRLWTGDVNGPQNSQQIADWYTFSHIIHGMLFFGLGWWLLRERSMGLRLALAVVIEGSWELLENSPIIIDRYRQATMALGYSGDSVLNSIADIGWMTLGFLVARRLPWPWTVAIAVGFELMTLIIIRDNLTLNVLMLVAPIDAIKVWQAG